MFFLFGRTCSNNTTFGTHLAEVDALRTAGHPSRLTRLGQLLPRFAWIHLLHPTISWILNNSRVGNESCGPGEVCLRASCEN